MSSPLCRDGNGEAEVVQQPVELPCALCGEAGLEPFRVQAAVEQERTKATFAALFFVMSFPLTRLAARLERRLV